MPEMEVSSCLSESSSIPSCLTKTDKPQPMQTAELSFSCTVNCHLVLLITVE